jgi:hypothetical protein
VQGGRKEKGKTKEEEKAVKKTKKRPRDYGLYCDSRVHVKRDKKIKKIRPLNQ